MFKAKRLLIMASLLLLVSARSAFCAQPMNVADFIRAERTCRAAASLKNWKSKAIPAECYFLNSPSAIATEKGKSHLLPLQYIPESYKDDLKAAKKQTAINAAKENFSKKLVYLEEEMPILIYEKDQVGSGAFKKTVTDILKSKEFAERKPRVIKIVPEWLRKWWEKLMSRMPKTERFDGFPPALSAFLKAAGVILAMFLISYIIYRVVNEYTASKKSDTAEIEALETADDPIRTSAPEELLRAARAFAESGNYRDAARYVYISFVRAIEDAGLVAYLDVKTNREYLAELSGKKPVSANLRRMNSIYEDIWYGMRPLESEDYKDFCGLYDKCLKEMI